jgi:hypothetical protein
MRKTQKQKPCLVSGQNHQVFQQASTHPARSHICRRFIVCQLRPASTSISSPNCDFCSLVTPNTISFEACTRILPACDFEVRFSFSSPTCLFCPIRLSFPDVSPLGYLPTLLLRPPSTCLSSLCIDRFYTFFLGLLVEGLLLQVIQYQGFPTYIPRELVLDVDTFAASSNSKGLPLRYICISIVKVVLTSSNVRFTTAALRLAD